MYVKSEFSRATDHPGGETQVENHLWGETQTGSHPEGATHMENYLGGETQTDSHPGGETQMVTHPAGWPDELPPVSLSVLALDCFAQIFGQC